MLEYEVMSMMIMMLLLMISWEVGIRSSLFRVSGKSWRGQGVVLALCWRGQCHNSEHSKI